MSVYLDHNATAPLNEPAREAMTPWFSRRWGNAASIHAHGQVAAAAVDLARARLRTLVGGDAGEVVFTGSGTEAVVTALVGGAQALVEHGRHIVVSAIEHAAGEDAARFLEERGWAVTRVRPETDGRVLPERVTGALRPDTALVSILHANNETGVIQPIEDAARAVREHGARLHVDAVQSAGKIRVTADAWGADWVSVAAHKLGGPQGIGALWRAPGAPLRALIPGVQEGGRRGGTVNVAGAVGFGAAALHAADGLSGYEAHCRPLRERLEQRLRDRIPGVRIMGAASPRLPNTAQIVVPGAGPDLVPALDLEGFSVSSGSACRSGSQAPSHVLTAMGVDPAEARTAVRISLGMTSTAAEVDAFVEAIARLARAR
jgi:cysteine desulfurase